MGRGKETQDNDEHGNPKRGDTPDTYQCGVCHGSGSVGDKKCWNCDGEGEV